MLKNWELGKIKVKRSIQEYKTKEVFIDEIVEKVEKQNKKIYVDWMTRVDKGKPIWKQTIINPPHDYSLERTTEKWQRRWVSIPHTKQSNY